VSRVCASNPFHKLSSTCIWLTHHAKLNHQFCAVPLWPVSLRYISSFLSTHNCTVSFSRLPSLRALDLTHMNHNQSIANGILMALLSPSGQLLETYLNFQRGLRVSRGWTRQQLRVSVIRQLSWLSYSWSVGSMLKHYIHCCLMCVCWHARLDC
jgi:hypothetical protein